MRIKIQVRESGVLRDFFADASKGDWLAIELSDNDLTQIAALAMQKNGGGALVVGSVPTSARGNQVLLDAVVKWQHEWPLQMYAADKSPNSTLLNPDGSLAVKN